MPQRIDACLLLGHRPCAVDRRRARRDAAVERTGSPQVRDVSGADHDLGGYAADVDAGATDRAALDQCDARTSFNGFQRGRHRRTSAADNCNMQRRPVVPGCGVLNGLGIGAGRRRRSRDAGAVTQGRDGRDQTLWIKWPAAAYAGRTRRVIDVRMFDAGQGE